MDIIQVGPHQLEDWDLNEVMASADLYSWFVYWYENEGYDGHGEAVGLRKSDGMLVYRDLSHCSCYGPLEGWATGATATTIEEFLRHKDDIHTYDAREELKKEVNKLLEQR